MENLLKVEIMEESQTSKITNKAKGLYDPYT